MIEKRKRFFADFKFSLLIILFLFMIVFSVYLHSRGFRFNDVLDFAHTKYGPLAFIIFYSATSFIPLPFAPTSFVGPLIYPLYRAFFYTFIGSLLFSVIMFYIARFLGKEFAEVWLEKHKKFKDMRLSFIKEPIKKIIFLRLFFILPAELVNVVTGLSKISFKDYFIGTFIGNLPVIFFSCALIRSRIRQDDFLFNISIIALGLCILIPLFFIPNMKKFFKHHEN